MTDRVEGDSMRIAAQRGLRAQVQGTPDILVEMQRLVAAGCAFKISGYLSTRARTVTWVGHVERDGETKPPNVTGAPDVAVLLEHLLADAGARWPELFA